MIKSILGHKGDKPSEGKGGSRHQQDTPKTQASAWAVDDFQVDPKEGETRFHDIGLRDELMHAIADLGFEYCSPIQAAILPHTLQGHDAIGKAQTGTGKTAAFLVTIFNDMLCNPMEGERFVGEPRALVIAPTRELVMQIAADAADLAKYTDLQVVTLIGGMDYQKQLNRLHNHVVDLVVATPGRLLDFMGRRDLYLDHIEVLVLDEGDRMLDMGFIPQVKRIVVCGTEAILLFRMVVRAPNGGGMGLDVCDHMQVDEAGRIRSARAFWDPQCMVPLAECESA